MHVGLIAACLLVPLLAALLSSADLRRWVRGKGSVRQTVSNAAVGVMFALVQLLLRGTLLAIFAAVATLVPWKLPDHPLSYVAAFVLLDLVYYVQHRLEHSAPLLWAIHSVHHQSEDYNLSVSFRVGALSSFSTLCFHALLAIAGVSATQYAVVVTIHAVLLFSLHAQTKIHFGPGRLFNAPVFHRVHHGADVAYVDKNFGGVFLVFDRVFGTFAPYTAEPHFGVAGQSSPSDPLRANYAPMAELIALVATQPTLGRKIRALFVRPRS